MKNLFSVVFLIFFIFFDAKVIYIVFECFISKSSGIFLHFFFVRFVLNQVPVSDSTTTHEQVCKLYSLISHKMTLLVGGAKIQY